MPQAKVRAGLSRRFSADRRGDTAIVFALALLPIALAAGAALDLRRQATSKSHLQDAADTAVLAGVREYFRNTRLSDDARLELAQQAATRSIDVHVRQHARGVLNVNSEFVVDAETGQAVLTAAGASPAAFGGLFGIKTLPFNVRAEGVAGGRPVEITLVLDNTTSMFAAGPTGGQRFTIMREAAMQYVNDVYDLAGERAKVSVVPWTTLVNINSEAVAAPDAATGSVSPAGVQGSRRTPVTPYADRLGMLAEPTDPGKALTAKRLQELAQPVGWRGCIRSATGEVAVNGSGNVTSPISDAAPSGRWPAAVLASSRGPQGKRSWCERETYWVEESGGGGGGGGGGGTPSPKPPLQGSLDRPDGSVMLASWNGQSGGFRNLLWSQDDGLQLQDVKLVQRERCKAGTTVKTDLYWCNGSGSTGWHDGGRLNAYYPHLDPSSGQPQKCSTSSQWGPLTQTGVNETCVSDPNEIRYFRTGGKSCPWQKDAFPGGSPSWTKWSPISGPNLNCPVSILPLSQNRRQVLEKLNEMYPVPGGTLPDVGLLWALRTLSPSDFWTSFWGLSAAEQKPTAYKSRQADKIVILLTDGRSETPYDYEGYYGCTKKGRGAAGDCWVSPNVKNALKPMNAYSAARWDDDNAIASKMTASACKQLREEYGIDVYYILVDVPGKDAEQEAKRCAPEPGRARSVSSAELGTVFTDLVQRQLRLTK